MNIQVPRWVVVIWVIMMIIVALNVSYESHEMSQIKEELSMLQGCEIHD